MFSPIPSEFPVAGIYVAPALLVVLVGLAAAWVAARILNRTRLARYFWNPQLAFLAIWALMSAVIGLLLISP